MSRSSTWPFLLVLACAGAPENEPELAPELAPEAGPDRASAPAAPGDVAGPEGSGSSADPARQDDPDAHENSASTNHEALPLPLLDLLADAPRDAEVHPAIVGEGVTIHADELNVQVALAGPQTPATLAAAKAEAQLFAPTTLRETALSEGWVLTFESATAMGPSYWVQLRRDLGGRAIWCTSTSSSTARQLAALDLCASLRPS